ncbi:copper homeostasis protein CutC [Sphingobacterium sp. UT-1RO-CII-1]|uniref:copper homeostasis protein CutC n=1 Tax=Sphingobacterium sp. UT-1RO-CII-1 TaxID=2995225 RepID=UPI00227AFDC6|nr:copper homeostasis protein CutC [Sphingobacterium sp. UT-1RO-CII-1]MCY4779745.1 copper homeostasis protein CutC [Sphingobacterium sp. UT-1RO-CII-1]
MERQINGYWLEVCSNSSYSAIQAQQGGASRIELCQNLENGGTTPSYAQIKRTRDLLTIGIHVLIRPRGGDFVYNDTDFEEIKEDIKVCKDLNCDGVVIGVLKPNGTVDVDRNRELVELAKPMTTVFHRAFDRCADPFQALEDVISLGFDRILTSGLKSTASEGKELLRELVEKAAGRIEIMPGAGVHADNIKDIIRCTGVKSIHSSAKIVVNSTMTYHSSLFEGMNEPTMETSVEKVKELCALLEELN